jgi:exodeoxyribonuclease VII small subunit
VTAKERAKEAATSEGGRPPGFEESLERLEAIVKTLEEGELPLEETLRLFEEGQALLKGCGELLARAELRVQELLRGTEGGLETRARDDLGAEAARGAASNPREAEEETGR